MNTNLSQHQQRAGSIYVALFSLGLALSNSPMYGGSATWNAHPLSSDWNTAANWTPATVPGTGDTASFNVSTTTKVRVSTITGLDRIVFDSGASAYNITVPVAIPNAVLSVAVGISNNSGVIQNFTAEVDDNGNAAAISITGTASAGSMNTFTTAGNFLSTNPGGDVDLVGYALAGSCTFINQGGITNGSLGGMTRFFTQATADHGTFINQGGQADGAEGGVTIFLNSTHAANSVLIANGGINGGEGGQIQFWSSSTGDGARVELFGNGLLDLTSHARAFSIGSVEGDGIVNLGGVGLTLGTNNLSTAFSGVIEDIGATTGSLGKAGTGIFTLAGANTYTAGTTISAGVLRVTNRAGSGTGAGPVNVTAGTLGGSGTIAGPVTIGSGSGPGPSLAPSVSVSRPATLTIQDTLSFKQESSYAYQLNTKKAKADQVTACGVTIENGAEFSFHPIAQRRLALGTSFLIINNTSATPIGGTFANLPDGTVLTVGRNKLQASYEGGDGNDLSLTVVP